MALVCMGNSAEDFFYGTVHAGHGCAPSKPAFLLLVVVNSTSCMAHFAIESMCWSPIISCSFALPQCLRDFYSHVPIRKLMVDIDTANCPNSCHVCSSPISALRAYRTDSSSFCMALACSSHSALIIRSIFAFSCADFELRKRYPAGSGWMHSLHACDVKM